MAVLPIIKLGHPSLRKVADPVSEFDEALAELSDNMIDTMRENEGIGLAGPQVNILKRIFVIDVEIIDESRPAQAYINPRILEKEGAEISEEGCLSIPDIAGEVERAATLEVEYQTLEGDTVQETLEGYHARVFQHELDHLNGVMFIDHLSFIQRKLLEPKLRKIKEDHSIS